MRLTSRQEGFFNKFYLKKKKKKKKKVQLIANKYVDIAFPI